jgi:hypothetical protein
VHVEEYDVGPVLHDRRDSLVDVGGLGDAVDRGPELGADAGAEHRMVVHDQDAGAHGFPSSRGRFSRTSVPEPGVDRISALPPWRVIRSTMLLRTPCRSAGMLSGSKPLPRSRTNTSTWVRLASA